MSWRLFIDDERFPIREDEWFIARDYNEACELVRKHGLPAYISFDHDLGDGPTGAAFADWLIGCMLNKMLKFPKSFDYYVHSQNPIGAANIRGKMDAAIKHIGYES
jgi:hypothetical protein